MTNNHFEHLNRILKNLPNWQWSLSPQEISDTSKLYGLINLLDDAKREAIRLIKERPHE